MSEFYDAWDNLATNFNAMTNKKKLHKYKFKVGTEVYSRHLVPVDCDCLVADEACFWN